MYSKTHEASLKSLCLCHIHPPAKEKVRFEPPSNTISHFKKGILWQTTRAPGGMLSDRNIGGNSHLPATDTQQEANHVGLLLLLDLFHVLEGTHLDGNRNISLWCSIFLFLDGCRAIRCIAAGITTKGARKNVPCRRGRSSIVVGCHS